jgi:hypothetical protein
MQLDGNISCWQECICGVPCLQLTILCARQNNVAYTQAWHPLGQGKQHPACADLDIVRMRADRKYR